MPPPPTSRQRGTGQRIQRNRASSTPRSSAAGAPSNRQSQLPGAYTDVQRGPSHPPVEPKDPLQAIGEETVLAIQQGGYKTPDGRRQTIAEACQQLQGPGTRFHSSDNIILDNWRRPPTTSDGATAVSGSDTIDVHFRLQSTLAAAREWAWSARAPYERIGVLSCAHPTVPGGGFNTSTGAFKSQEASLNRASNLSYALFSPTAAPFYSLHKTTQGINNGFFSNAMVYAQDVTLVRDDFHEWAFPLKVDVVNATPVDANEVQRALVKQGGMPKETMRKLVREALEERMGRILRLFELEGDNVLILTGFGAGACGNPMSTVARIWARLLGPGGRFYGKFVNVIFAIPSDMPFHEFSSSFNDAIARGSDSRDQPPRSA
ncbi:hypothetical protein FRC04_008665 [Tulasnella sp. 424]|nr:hypothetical protein FRC04_008665 [Tulasnella sp. 424]